MSSHLCWCWLCRMCEKAYLKYAQGVVIPLTSSYGRKAKHLSFSHLYYVAKTSTSSIRVVLEHTSTLPGPRRGLHFETL